MVAIDTTGDLTNRSTTSLDGGGGGGGAGGGGGKPNNNLPVIEHPMTRLDRDNLSVRGQSSASAVAFLSVQPPTRQRTFVTVDDGQVKLGLDRSNLPPLGPGAKDWTGRSLSHEVDTFQIVSGGRMVPSRIVSPPEYSPRAGRWDGSGGFSCQELQYMIAERLAMGFHGVQHLFKGNDPNGEGVVSKEALLKIIYTICGYVTTDQFTKLLKSIGLHGKSTISFKEFASCFKDTKKPSKVWLSPAQRVAMATPTKRTDMNGLKYRNGAVSATFCHCLLKDRARAGEFRITDVLPESSLEPGGMIIPPQLHDMISHLGYKLSEEEFTKLWHRYDASASGAVPTTTFFKKLGLSETGQARPSTSPRHAALLVAPPGPQQKEPKQPVESQSQETTQEKETKATGPQEEPTKKLRLAKKSSATPRLDKITHCLHYKFEEGFNNLLQGMQCFDFLKDGFIARIDFKKVLEEFGMPISVMDLEFFLSRCGVRSIHGQIVYKDFLMKFFNRAESGLVHRVVSRSPLMFGEGRLPPLEPGSALTAEHLEIRLVDYIHSDFLTLMVAFRHCDKYNLGVITKYEFRAALERLLGYGISEEQYTELLSEINLDKDGLVPYTAFLEGFSKPPGSWNQRQVAGHAIAAVRQDSPPGQTGALQAEADELMSRVRAEVAAEEQVAERELRKSQGMNVKELNDCLADFFHHKFHSFDKVLKSFDRKMTGRFSVHQFAEILKQCGLVLLPAEVDRLWAHLPVTADNMLSFSALMRHVTSLHQGPSPITNKMIMEDAGHLVERARQVIQERKQKQREAEQTIEQPVKVLIRRSMSREGQQLLERLRFDVTQHWEKLKQLLRHMDPIGKAVVPEGHMRDVIKLLRFRLSEADISRLLALFTDANSGMFNYINFLKYYTKSKGEITMTESYGLSEKLGQKLTKEWKKIRRTFRKMDPSSRGYLGVDDFRAALTSHGIDIGDEDLFRILSEFDTDMAGRISYEHFLNKALVIPAV